MCTYDFVDDRWVYPSLLDVSVGVADLGDGVGPWIPSEEELEQVRDDFDRALGEDYRVLVHHFGVEVTPLGPAPYSEGFMRWLFERPLPNDVVGRIVARAKVGMAERLGIREA